MSYRQATPNPSLQPTCYGWLCQPTQAAELKRWASRQMRSRPLNAPIFSLPKRLPSATARSVCVTSLSALISLPNRCARVRASVCGSRDASRILWSCVRLWFPVGYALSWGSRYAGINAFVHHAQPSAGSDRPPAASGRTAFTLGVWR